MKFLCLAAGLFASVLQPAQAGPEAWRAWAAAEYGRVEKSGAGALAGADGWLFLTAELRFLSPAQFWGDAASRTGRSAKPELADPVPAIVDFQRQLKGRGIALLLVPVPPKAALASRYLPGAPEPAGALEPLERFYGELRAGGIDVLDLAPVFGAEKPEGAMYCRTDSHWSGLGCAEAARAIAERVRPQLGAGATAFAGTWKELPITGDLEGLLPAGAAKPGPETIPIRTVAAKDGGAAVEPDTHSPLLLLGDSHTLVFHEFLAEHAGLADQLALELGLIPDVLGTRGSGAAAARLNLYRRSLKDPGYLQGKKVVVWCFAAREFTESTEGWPKLPVAK